MCVKMFSEKIDKNKIQFCFYKNILHFFKNIIIETIRAVLRINLLKNI